MDSSLDFAISINGEHLPANSQQRAFEPQEGGLTENEIESFTAAFKELLDSIT